LLVDLDPKPRTEATPDFAGGLRGLARELERLGADARLGGEIDRRRPSLASVPQLIEQAGRLALIARSKIDRFPHVVFGGGARKVEDRRGPLVDLRQRIKPTNRKRLGPVLPCLDGE
jgi:hypothetical protein